VTRIQRAHQARVHSRRMRILAKHLGEMIPSGASVLDVGSGDGLLARRPDLTWSAIDTLERPQTHVPAGLFDGRTPRLARARHGTRGDTWCAQALRWTPTPPGRNMGEAPKAVVGKPEAVGLGGRAMGAHTRRPPGVLFGGLVIGSLIAAGCATGGTISDGRVVRWVELGHRHSHRDQPR
jgi:hypothetical protein